MLLLIIHFLGQNVMKITVSENAFSFNFCLLKKNIILRLVFLFVSILMLFYFVSKSMSFLYWFEWWSVNRMPIKVVGYIKEVSESHGKRNKYKYLYVSSNNGLLRLDSSLSKKELLFIKSLDKLMSFEFYPTASGRKWVLKISRKKNGQTYYEGTFHDDGWHSIVVFLFIVFYFVFSILSLFFVFRDFETPLRVNIR